MDLGKKMMREICQEWPKQKLVSRKGSGFPLRGSETGSIPPVWWFERFDPSWVTLRTWFDRKQMLTLSELQLVVDHVSGLTSIEKTIAVSAFVAYKNMQC